LPLESYPPDVWKTFIFDQETVTSKMGATPNGVRDEARPVLFELVNPVESGTAVEKVSPAPQRGGMISSMMASGSAPQRIGKRTLPSPRDTTSSEERKA